MAVWKLAHAPTTGSLICCMITSQTNNYLLLYMTYNAEVQFKFDATYTHDYNRGFGSSIGDDEFIPEEHYVITAPAADLNAKQYFKLFEKFMLCVGMCPASIRSGAMSLVFNDYVNEEEQRKVCNEYELTMDEDLRDRFDQWKKDEEEIARFVKGPMGTVQLQQENYLTELE